MKSASASQVKKFRELARTVFEHHFGKPPRRLTHRAGGLSNFVFEAQHKKDKFIVRIGPEAGRLDAFIKEQWCERVARKAGIPTAEVLETGSTAIAFPYVIAQSVDGVSAVEHPERVKIVTEMGRLAARINRIKTKGFGETFDWSNNKLSRKTTFQDYLEYEFQIDERIELIERVRLTPPETLKAIRRVARELKQMRPRPFLNHGDLRLKNVIVDEAGRIQAVIDWEKATSNAAPHWEMSLALHDLGIDACEAFVKGYGITSKRLKEIAPIIKTLNLLNYRDAVNEALRSKDKKALDQLRLRLSGVFDLYSF